MVEATARGTVAVTIDGRKSEVPEGGTILDAARQMGIHIPTLCHYRGLSPYGACRICLVEADTGRGPRLVASCNHPVEAGLVVDTGNPAVIQARRTVLELLLAQAPESPELATIACDLGVESTPYEPATEGKCILCGLCVRACRDLMGRSAINLYARGADREVRTPFGEKTDQCQACGACALVCPTGAIDLGTITERRLQPHVTSYDQNLSARPCIDLAHPQAAPRVPVIDRDSCVHLQTGECGLCAEVCGAGAIDYQQPTKTFDLSVGAVVLTQGFEAFDPVRRSELGFGFSPNVLTNVQFERMLSASGPTAGQIRRPSDGAHPKRLAFIQCVGSRDHSCGNEYCSSICCMAATKEAILAKEHQPDLDVTIFFLDLRAFGKDFDRYCERAQQQLGVKYVRSFISRTYEMPGTQNLQLVHVDDRLGQVEAEFDLVVLSLGLEPNASAREQAKRMKVALNPYGFAATKEIDPLQTSRPGVLVGGAFQEPKDIPDTVVQASGAAARAMVLLSSARGREVRVKPYPPERDITDEPPRIGVFVCHCGSNIASVVDVSGVSDYATTLPNVAYSANETYVCADDTQQLLKQRVQEHHLNRVIVASCTPRTHEPIFRDTLREVGLNPYLLEMVNIRDQCSWVHSADHANATKKARDLVRMAVARASVLLPLQDDTVPVQQSALVIGGGIAGMTAALGMAEQGFPVHLVEQAAELGGTALRVSTTLDGQDVAAHLKTTIGQVTSHPLIEVYLRSTMAKVEGHIGELTSTISNQGDDIQVRHGVVVLATGATEHRPTSYRYGEDRRVVTQLELSERLGKGRVVLPRAPTIVMIQCVEQRSAERPYCSRVCCGTAVKNALALKRRFPEGRIMVLYRDMRTYGFREVAYRKARELGVLFVRYEPETPPVLVDGAALRIEVREPALGRALQVEPDLLVLAAPAVPRADRQELSELLRVPLNADGFFLEAHMKLRPVDFASEGLFLCGAAHAPKFINETISQANAAVGRAAGILSKERMTVSGQTAWVDPDRCVSCMTCLHVCPYMAPRIDPNNKAEVQGAVCMGCGSCASECPARAIALRHYGEDQVVAAVEGLLGASSRPSETPTYPEEAGIAPPRWRSS